MWTHSAECEYFTGGHINSAECEYFIGGVSALLLALLSPIKMHEMNAPWADKVVIACVILGGASRLVTFNPCVNLQH